jgi:hypothetical protein
MEQRQFGRQRITRGALYLLIATTGVSLLFAFTPVETQARIARWIIATDESVWKELHLWKLVTTALIPLAPHESGVALDFLGLIIQGVMLWFFLPALEGWWGMRRFLFFALWTCLAAAVVGTLVGLAIPGVDFVSGLDPLTLGGIVAFGVLYSDHPVRFFGAVPLTGKQLAIGFTVVFGLIVLIGQRWAEGASMAGAMGLALLLTNGKWTPKLAYLKWKQKRIRKKLKVIQGGDKEPKKWVN